ncbi:MAG TPA: GtrA family protein [Novosphingobium sp.]
MRRQLNMIRQILSGQQGRYLVVGGFNTVINYVISAALYSVLLPRMNFFLVSAIVTFVCISVSFTTQKTLVFRTKGGWLREYLRSYVVYGSSALLNTGLMWVLLKRVHLNVWLAQALVTAIAVTISYVGHTTFTFRPRKPRNPAAAAMDSSE